MFANLFDKVPARRAGRLEDIAGTVLYLCSKAGVSTQCFELVDGFVLTVLLLQAYVDGRCLCVDGGRVLVANGQE